MEQKESLVTLENLYKKINELRVEAKNDLILNSNNLFDDMNISELSMKWLDRYYDYRKLITLLNKKRLDSKRKLYEFYKTDFQLKLTNKDELELFIESDKEYIEINQLYIASTEALDFIEKVMGLIKQKGFDVKNKFDWMRFTNGVI